MRSITLPKGGKNSCRLFILAINVVIFYLFVLFVNCCFAIFFFNSSTFLTAVNLDDYFHGCQVLFVLFPNVPSITVASSVLTFTKDEKYFALFDSSPHKNAIIFLSFGNSAI